MNPDSIKIKTVAPCHERLDVILKLKKKMTKTALQ